MAKQNPQMIKANEGDRCGNGEDDNHRVSVTGHMHLIRDLLVRQQGNGSRCVPDQRFRFPAFAHAAIVPGAAL